MATATVPRGSTNGKAPRVVLDRDVVPPAGATGAIVQIPLDLIDVGDNVRVNVEAIDELAASIAEHGVLQPIKVRDASGDRYLVTWGQRRVLAARKAGLERIPAIVGEPDLAADKLSIEQLVENLHRADLNPIDRAAAMRAVVDAGVSQADLARRLGIAPSTIANDLGLLEAPAKVRDLVERGELTPSHAKALKGLAASTQSELATAAVRDGLSAHATEELVQRHKSNEEWRQKRQREEEQAHKEAASRLESQFGNLEKKKVAKDARILVTSWDGKARGALVERIQKLGYTDVVQARSHDVASRSSAVGCDCKAWKVELDYSRLTIVPACVVDKHQKAKSAADEQRRRDKHATETKVHEYLTGAGPSLVNVWNGFDSPRFLSERRTAQMLLWHALDYRLPDWSEKLGGKRGNPWAVIQGLTDTDLATELGKAIAQSFRDRYGNHVPWAALAVELGLVEAPAP